VYILLKYRAYVMPVVCSARIAKFLVSKTPSFNFWRRFTKKARR
jgi:hypothetical protein